MTVANGRGLVGVTHKIHLVCSFKYNAWTFNFPRVSFIIIYNFNLDKKILCVKPSPNHLLGVFSKNRHHSFYIRSNLQNSDKELLKDCLETDAQTMVG